MLILYPNTDYDSFISVADADEVISNNSVHSAQWLALTEAQKEVYLRVATTRILNITTALDVLTYVAANSCLPKSCALIGIHDVVYGISSEVNPNTGIVSKEKVGDLEVTYFHGNPNKQVKGRTTSPFPSEVKPCLESYGAVFSQGSIQRATLIKA